MRITRRGLAARLIMFALLAVPAARVSAQGAGIPDRLSDAEFWHMFSDFSEANGLFSSENLLSNETGFQNVIPELLRTVRPGGVYLGVGPEQNFTYIAALHPKMAFICDIRHQNGVYHLLYKALIEMSDNRVDFLSKLFSRPRPAGLSNNISVDSLFSAFAAVQHDSILYYKTLAAVKDHLIKDHGFALSPEELKLLEGNFDALYWNGPDLSYSVRTVNAATTTGGGFGGGGGGGGRGGRGGNFVNYQFLMTATDNAGVKRSYLANEANYQVLRDLEMRNMLVPVTGDFGNGTALRNIGDYVRKQGATITTFYTSNAEQYVFGSGNWFKFEAAVATFPLDSTSTFIRSGRPGGGSFAGGGAGMSQSLLQSMMNLVKMTADGRIQGYQDVLMTSH